MQRGAQFYVLLAYLFKKGQGNFNTNTMENEGEFSRKTTIYVSTSSKLNVEQTQSITGELLRIIGYPAASPAVQFQFIDGGELVQANASVDSEFRVSIKD